MSEGFSSTDKMTELRRLNDQVNFLEAENARLRKAGEAYVSKAIQYHTCSLVRSGEKCGQCFSEYEKAHHEWREACDG